MVMIAELDRVNKSLKKLFPSAYDIFIDPLNKECELKISVDEFLGELTEKLVEDGIRFQMVDYWDVLPFKYVFEYQVLSGEIKK